MAKELDEAAVEDAFLGVENDTALLKERKDCSQLAAVLGCTGLGDKDVAQIL
jgi:hypothetical protein